MLAKPTVSQVVRLVAYRFAPFLGTVVVVDTTILSTVCQKEVLNLTGVTD